MSLFRTLLGATALTAAAPPSGGTGASQPPAGTEPAPEGGALTEERIEAALQSAQQSGHAEGVSVGAKAERERTAAVLGSAEGKANMAMAAWMLASSPDATAESIIAQLKTCPAQAAAPAPKPSALTTPLAETPTVDLTGGNAAEAAIDGAAPEIDSAAIWDSVQAEGSKRFYGSAFGAVAPIAQGGMNGATALLPTGN